MTVVGELPKPGRLRTWGKTLDSSWKKNLRQSLQRAAAEGEDREEEDKDEDDEG